MGGRDECEFMYQRHEIGYIFVLTLLCGYSVIGVFLYMCLSHVAWFLLIAMLTFQAEFWGFAVSQRHRNMA